MIFTAERPPLVVLGNRSSKRLRDFSLDARRLGFAETQVLPYFDFITRRVSLADWLPARCVLRIESPGEDWEVEKLILSEGIGATAEEGGDPISKSGIARLPFRRGAIVRPRQWYLGYSAVLARIAGELDQRSDVTVMADPRDVVTLFDKSECQMRFEQVGIPVPRFWTGITSYDQLRGEFRGERHRRLFVKLLHGFSAMGSMALEWLDGKVRAIAPMEFERSAGGSQLFVTKRVRVYTDELEIAELVDLLAKERILVEEWLPKARLNGRGFDLRIVTIAGRACHVVGRASSSPFTNLNLDAQRIEAERVCDHLGGVWPHVSEISEQVAASFPRSLYLGVDLLVSPRANSFAILEANAFGDYLPGLLHDGRSTYECELRAVLAARGMALCTT